MSEAPGGVERRLVLRLLEHWRDAEAEAEGMPGLEAMAGRDLDADIHGALFILRLQKDTSPLIETVGRDLVADLPDDPRGRPADTAPAGTLLAHALAFHERVRSKKIPITQGGQFEAPDGGTVFYRSIILPIAGRSGRLAFLMGAANCTVQPRTD